MIGTASAVLAATRTCVRALSCALFLLATAPAGIVAAADEGGLDAQALAALEAVFAALMTGDPDVIRPHLAPEFQVQRSDGKGYGKDDYLALSIPKIAAMPAFRDLAVTRNGDIAVVRLMLEIEETINGKVAERHSPQLMVFRIAPDGWQVVAAANFARLD